MIAIAFLFFFLVYLLISIGVTRLTVAWAKHHHLRPWVWGGLVAFLMYNLVFWDWLPTLAAHQYYCATEAGFWVYKSPEQWKEENPGVAETLSRYHLPEQYRAQKNERRDSKDTRYYHLPDDTWLTALYNHQNELMYVDLEMSNGSNGYWLNERFAWLINEAKKIPPSLIKRTEEIVDTKTGDLIARYTDFSMGYGNMMTTRDWRAMKFWMRNQHCLKGEWNNSAMANITSDFEYIR